MAIFSQMLGLQLQLFILILVGILLKKIGLIDVKGRKMLSDLLIDVILPCSIVASFLSGIDTSPEFAKNCPLALVICTVIQAAVIFLNRFLFGRFPTNQRSPMAYGLICSNSSFIGLPVVEALYGSMGVVYGSVFQIPIRFTMWSAGLSLFTSVDRKDAIKKLAVHPCILSVFIGLALMLLPVSLPGFALDTINALGRCTIPVSMLVIGSILADADIRTMFSGPILYFTLLRLIVAPLAVYGILSLLRVDPLLLAISVIMTGMPAGSTTSILADKYDCDSVFAAQLVFTSTLLSMVTMPLICLVL